MKPVLIAAILALAGCGINSFARGPTANECRAGLEVMFAQGSHYASRENLEPVTSMIDHIRSRRPIVGIAITGLYDRSEIQEEQRAHLSFQRAQTILDHIQQTFPELKSSVFIVERKSEFHLSDSPKRHAEVEIACAG